FSLPLIPYSLIGYFSTNHLDAIFISQYLSKSDLGVYSIAYQMNGILMQFPLLAGSLLLPLFVTLRTGGNSERVTTYMEDILPLLTFIGGIVAICAALAMTVFIPLVFGEKVDQAILIFWILISSAAFTIPALVGFSPFTNAISATYVASVMALVASVVNLTANYLLIPRYGLVGCAWATVLAYGTSAIVLILIGRFRFSLRHRWTIPAFLPPLTASIYASMGGDLITAFVLAIAVAFVIVLVWRKAVGDAVRILRDYRSFAAG
ncbi:MAG: polysaccharide biosynthesis C-terminal domain-containing protein, partial [Pyrinomonadaceae bacterium]